MQFQFIFDMFSYKHRTSNAERIYQEELTVALDQSRGEPLDNSDVVMDKKSDVIHEIITINESDDERVMSIVSCKKPRGK